MKGTISKNKILLLCFISINFLTKIQGPNETAHFLQYFCIIFYHLQITLFKLKLIKPNLVLVINLIFLITSMTSQIQPRFINNNE